VTAKLFYGRPMEYGMLWFLSIYLSFFLA